VSEARGGVDNKLELWGDAPRWEYSTAPLMAWDTGKPLAGPSAGSRGHALSLNDMQVSIFAVHPMGWDMLPQETCRGAAAVWKLHGCRVWR
jgi:hypothetical protein